MRKLVEYGVNRYWLIIAVTTIGPGLLAAVVEYLWTGGVSGVRPVSVALIGGVLSMVLLSFVRKREPSMAQTTRESHMERRPQEASMAQTTPESHMERRPQEASMAQTTPESRMERRSQEPSMAQTTQKILPEERIWSPRTVEELVSEGRGMTELAAERLHSRHIDQWLKVEGRVFGAWGTDDTVGISVLLQDTKRLVMMHFDKSLWGERSLALNVDDQIFGSGKIGHINSIAGFVSLEECELTDTPGSTFP